METALRQLTKKIQQMIDNGGNEEDLPAVISHIENEFIQIEKQQLEVAYDQGSFNESNAPSIQFDQFYKDNFN